MKRLETIQGMLTSELRNSLDDLSDVSDMEYYNKLLGDTSFLLSGILDLELQNSEDWSPERWIDDSLITKVSINENSVELWGIMIWGRAETTEQWTDPFYFEITLDNECFSFIDYTFLYSENDTREITYEEFNTERGMWDKDFYSDNRWNPKERDWRFIVNSKNINRKECKK